MKRILVVVLLLASCLGMARGVAQATEGASSYYFPGSSTAFAVAVAPEPGFMAVSQTLFYSGRANKAVLGRRVNFALEADAFYEVMGGFYTFEKPVLGSRLQVGIVVPVGHADVEAALGSRRASDNRTGIGDTMISAALYWQKGDFHYKLVESVFVPTGQYGTEDLANVGRNYWGFDTALAVTWLNAGTGTEISVTPGILFNTRNTATDYKSGNEFHVDFAVNQFLAQNLALGFHGYYYRQVSGDSGSGAKLGGFEGESFGIGPALLWMPKAGKGNLSVIAKWLHDVHQENRMHGDYGQLTVGYRF
jgi:hypothetical protein